MPETKEEQLKRESDTLILVNSARRRIIQIVQRLAEGGTRFEDIKAGQEPTVLNAAATDILDAIQQRKSDVPSLKERASLGVELNGLVAYVQYVHNGLTH